MQQHSVANLLNGDDAEERAVYVQYAWFGKLFVNVNAPVSTVNDWEIDDEDGQRIVFDILTKEWVPFTVFDLCARFAGILY